MKKRFINTLVITLLILSAPGCKKFVEIGPPKTEVIISEAFKEDDSAVSAVLGIYVNMLSNTNFENSGITIFSGLSADEIEDLTNTADNIQFQRNQLVPANQTIENMWSVAYNNLVLVNTCIEGLQKSTTLTPAIKDQLLGECKFSRAFLNFYLVSLWENIPLVMTSDWRQNGVIAQSSKEEVYTSMIKDLKEAQSQLKEAYPTAERVRPNKWTATALLARVYLYHKDYSNAETEASGVIGSGLYGPLPDLNQAFLKDSKEAIWQLMPSKNIVLTTKEGNAFIGDVDFGSVPNYNVTASLRNSFEAGDNRQTAWINQVDVEGQTYFYPFKYKDKGTYGTAPTEYYIMFRLAEQYMIRAEARARLNNFQGAMDDLNVIRRRAGLGQIQQLIPNADQAGLLTAIENENRHEFFAEWGHRWMDLKRTGRLDAVLSAQKTNWKSTAANFPIPQNDLNVNKKLVQNPGY